MLVANNHFLFKYRMIWIYKTRVLIRMTTGTYHADCFIAAKLILITYLFRTTQNTADR